MQGMLRKIFAIWKENRTFAARECDNRIINIM
jgi:hypothetical protein